MYKKTILTTFFLFISLSASQAAQSYTVSFVNNSSHKIFITSAAGNCMGTWKLPSNWTEVDPAHKLAKFTVIDKNSGNCINSDKIAHWPIRQDSLNGDDTLIVSMEHTRPNTHTWRTALTGVKNPRLKIELSGGYCDTPSGTVNCFNQAVDNVSNGGTIEFIITDSPDF